MIANMETVACKFCGTPTRMTGTRMCDSCYEVDKRIDDFVTSRAGLRRAIEAVHRSGCNTIADVIQRLREP